MADKPNPFGRLSAGFADSPDPKARKKLESQARTYRAYSPEERQRYKRLLALQKEDRAAFERITDATTRIALGHFVRDHASYEQLKEETT